MNEWDLLSFQPLLTLWLLNIISSRISVGSCSFFSFFLVCVFQRMKRFYIVSTVFSVYIYIHWEREGEGEDLTTCSTRYTAASRNTSGLSYMDFFNFGPPLFVFFLFGKRKHKCCWQIRRWRRHGSARHASIVQKGNIWFMYSNFLVYRLVNRKWDSCHHK